MGLINKVDMVCLSPVGYGVWLGLASGSWLVAVIHLRVVTPEKTIRGEAFCLSTQFEKSAGTFF